MTDRRTSASTQGKTWPFTSIILLTWNQCQLTTDCLDSLADLDYPKDRLQIIVCDNGSRDNTPAIIRERYPHVVMIENGDNVGFAAGNNSGVHHALQGSADYIMLLNNDTVVAPDMLTRLIEAAERDPQIGIVTPKIYYFDEPQRIWCAGAAIDWRNGETRRLQAEEIDTGQSESNHGVGFASGCAMCVRRSLVDQKGLLDERFFIYYEETEWCVRLLSDGLGCLYVPGSKVWHKISSAMQAGSPRSAYYMTRNRLLFLRKTQHGWRGLVALSRALGREIIYITVMTLRPRHRARRVERNTRAHGVLDFLRGRFGKMPESYVSTAKS